MKLNLIERLFVNSPVRLFMQSAEVNWMYRKLPLSNGGTMLEIGCGRGVGGKLINQKFKPSRLYLTDLDLKMVRKARYYLNGDHQANFHFCHSDATYLPYGDQKFDAVFGFGFLHHVPHWRDSLAEVSRILKTGGAYYLVEFYPQLYQNVITRHLLVHPTFDRFKSQDFKQAFKKTGINLTHAIEIESMGIVGIGIKG